MREQTKQLIKKYYEAFNRKDLEIFLSLLDDNVHHDINQGERETGKAAFEKFLTHMNQCYQEKISNLVILVNDTGSRAAAEFTVDGTYLVTDNGFPKAKNQTYQLAAGAFFEIQNNKITRLTNYYNVDTWKKMISV